MGTVYGKDKFTYVKVDFSRTVITNLVVNKHLVIMNRSSEQTGHFTTHINPVIKNRGYKEQKCFRLSQAVI